MEKKIYIIYSVNDETGEFDFELLRGPAESEMEELYDVWYADGTEEPFTDWLIRKHNFSLIYDECEAFFLDEYGDLTI